MKNKAIVSICLSVALAGILPVRGQELTPLRWETARAEEDAGALALDPREDLKADSYLSHAAELPDATESPVVLDEYLRLGAHGASAEARDREIENWEVLSALFPQSRYAASGVAHAYRNKSEQLGGDSTFARRALEAFVKAQNIAWQQHRLLFTREVSELAVQLGDRELLVQVFGPLVEKSADLRADDTYVLLVDFADGLASLGDRTAWDLFDRALAIHPGNRIEAVNRYAEHLLAAGEPAKALAVLDQYLPARDRARLVSPAFLRRQALGALGLDTRAADLEIASIRLRYSGGTPGLAPSLPLKKLPPFHHDNAADDCRSPQNAQNGACDDNSLCINLFTLNLAEILWNEARSESVGAQDTVGWTVRDRALEGVSCDAYVGGVTASRCRSKVPCSGLDPYCDLSRWYCCVEHGGTTAVGSRQAQFNDAHVALANLISSGTFYQAYNVVNGWVPDVSVSPPFIPPGASDCDTGCGGSFCNSGVNGFDPSPAGPMEYLGYNYCARNTKCKTYSANVCGGNPKPAKCTPKVAGDNYFWNRRP